MIPLKVTDVGGGAGEIREWVVGDTLPVSLGGSGAPDAAGARVSFGLKSAAVADILGTVSQTSGVPTGAIVQRGSNANGEFVRFADGTQICTRQWTENINVAASSVISMAAWTFPAVFAAIGYGAVTAMNVNADTLKSNLYLSGGTSCTPQTRNIHTAAITGDRDFCAFVIGRWF